MSEQSNQRKSAWFWGALGALVIAIVILVDQILTGRSPEFMLLGFAFNTLLYGATITLLVFLARKVIQVFRR